MFANAFGVKQGLERVCIRIILKPQAGTEARLTTYKKKRREQIRLFPAVAVVVAAVVEGPLFNSMEKKTSY